MARTPGPQPADDRYVIAAANACSELGISADGARMLAKGRCAIVALPAAGLCARIARECYTAGDLDMELQIARQFSDSGLPFLAPADHILLTPFQSIAGPLTLWPLLKALPRDSLDWHWLGQTLARLHSRTIPEHAVSLWNPYRTVRDRINDYRRNPHADSAIQVLLVAALQELDEMAERLISVSPISMIHGDAHPDNVLVSENGPVLFDYDLAGIGPSAWDLTETIALSRHRGLPDVLTSAFIVGYGYDATVSPEFSQLMRVRELLDMSFLLTLVGRHPRAESELAMRLENWVANPYDRTEWTFFRETA